MEFGAFKGKAWVLPVSCGPCRLYFLSKRNVFKDFLLLLKLLKCPLRTDFWHVDPCFKTIEHSLILPWKSTLIYYYTIIKRTSQNLSNSSCSMWVPEGQIRLDTGSGWGGAAMGWQHKFNPSPLLKFPPPPWEPSMANSSYVGVGNLSQGNGMGKRLNSHLSPPQSKIERNCRCFEPMADFPLDISVWLLSNTCVPTPDSNCY